MSRIELAQIKSLIFYQDSLTKARRTSPIPQLVCVGKPCQLYTPEVVRCVSLGGEGTSVDWKCEADLPESLRFGKVEVSCEGWSRPGDPFVLKDSCSLEYRLVQVPGYIRNSGSFDIASIIFYAIWLAFLALIVYSLFRSCFGGSGTTGGATPGARPRPGGSGGWFPGGFDDHSSGPPPPYSKTATGPADSAWRPGFWTGAALGGLGAHLWNRQAPSSNRYDWERDGNRQYGSPGFTGGRRAPASYDDRGEGSSNLGAMRRSTGFGTSNVR